MIKDFVYFDIEKAISILSQLEGKLITEFSEQVEESKDERNIRQYDLKLFKPEFGGVKLNKNSILQTGIMHHNIFNLLESKLKENNLLTDINKDIEPQENSEFLCKALNNKYYVVVEGFINIEDFTRIEFILNRYNSIIDFLKDSTLSGVQESDEYKEIIKEISNKRENANQIVDKNKRRHELKKIDEAEQQIKDSLLNSINIDKLPDWLDNGIKLFIDTFFKNRMLIRVYPYKEKPENHFIGNLKSDCFIDTDINNIINAYGTKPNIRLTMLGLITSLPTPEGISFNSLDEYDIYGDKFPDTLAFEKAFREIFNAMDKVEEFVKFTRFPNITLYPIAVYRKISVEQK